MIRKKILILGKNGFLGKSLSAKLSKTNFVISFGTRKKRGQEIILKNLLKINYRFDIF